MRNASHHIDYILIGAVVLLLAFGAQMVYSASVIEATVVFRDAQYFLKRQAMFGGAALAVIWVTSRIDYRRLRPLTYPVLGSVFVLLVLAVIGLGHTEGEEILERVGTGFLDLTFPLGTACLIGAFGEVALADEATPFPLGDFVV